jgi:TolA-binding protein
MSDNRYISENEEEIPLPTELLPEQVVTQEMTPVEKMIPLEASIEPTVTEEKPRRPDSEFTQEKHHTRKMTRMRQTSAKIGQLLKQAKRNEVEIFEMRKSIEYLGNMEMMATRSNLQLLKQLRSQLAHLRNQVTRIQKDLKRIRTTTPSRTNTGKIKASSVKTTLKARSKKGGSTLLAKTRRRRRTR